ncbi:uncharacterized protein LOC121107859 [Gallus gallus]|uniref:uncharacterized protein LOC121107859 n=1 Tax=Gallus gallus TaxID=9031 RepID=UPI001AEA3C45|nr:uncharacterized protein LOC121107859 [Gallus gallus]
MHSQACKSEAMLCLWGKGGHHQLCRVRLCAKLPSTLRHGWGMHHPVLWAAQVRAISSSQAKEECAATPPSGLPEPEPGPVAPSWSSALLAVLPTQSSSPRSFCREHRPRQASEGGPAQGIYCIFCLEPVGDSISYHTMLCPVCKQAHFHRGCIQRYAMSAGIMHFQCPVCAEKSRFRLEMNTMGLQIPVRPPSWETNASALLQERHRHCDASECYYPGGREQAEEEGPWKLLLCSSCAAQGTHRHCSFLTSNVDIWECESCGGVGTASRGSLEAARRRHPRSGGRGQPQNHFPIQESASGSQRKSRRYRDSSSTPAPHAQDITRGSARAATLRTLGGSPHRRQSRQQGRVQTRSRSLLKGQASDSRRRSRRRGGSGCTSARGAQSSTHRSARSVTSRSSRGSPLPEYRRRSRQRGQSHTRSRSPVGCRASSSQSQSQRGRGSSSRQQGPAGPQSHSRLQHRSRHPHSQSRRQQHRRS